MPESHHTLEKYLDEYLSASGIAGDAGGPLFLTTGRKTGQAQPMWQHDVYRMIQRRAAAAGITAYLKNGGTLERVRQIANHASCTTKSTTAAQTRSGQLQ